MKNRQNAIVHSTFPYGDVISIQDRHLPVPNNYTCCCIDAVTADINLCNNAGGKTRPAGFRPMVAQVQFQSMPRLRHIACTPAAPS
jgi:hypothetical protein